MSERDDRHAEGIALALHRMGRTRASGELLEAIEPTVRRAIARSVRGDEVDDLVQEALLRLTVRFAQWNPLLGEFPAWAATVARNLTIDYARRDERAQTVLGPDDVVADEGAVDAIAAVADASVVETIFRRLADQGDTQAQRVLAAMCNLAGSGEPLTHPAVAGAARVSESTVRRAQTRIRAVAREVEQGM